MDESGKFINHILSMQPNALRAVSVIEPAKQASRRAAYAVVTLCLAVVHLLLPIERGFPVIRIAGYPFTLTLLVSVAAFVFVVVDSNGSILHSLPKRYFPYQILVTITLLLAALLASDMQAGLFVVLSYCATFALDFLVVYYLFRRGFRRAFVLIICGVAATAATIGIVEGLFRLYVGVYADWFLGFDFATMSFAMTRTDFRALGTLGNPILYAVAMTLAVPFALEIRNRVIRYGLVAALFLASCLALSTTAVVVWFVYSIGFMVLSQQRKQFVLLAIILVGVGMGVRTSLAGDDAVNFDATVQRLVVGNLDNTNTRQLLRDQALELFRNERSVITILFGHGLKTAIEVVRGAGVSSLTTLDNAYATLLYETGLAGLGAFGLMGVNVIVSLRRFARQNLHWYAALSLFVMCLVFDAVYYSTFNFLWVASVASLAFEAKSRSRDTFTTATET